MDVLSLLKPYLHLEKVPFTERGSRLLLMKRNGGLNIRLAERWFKLDPRISAYRQRPPIVEELYFTDGDGNPLEYTYDFYPHRLDFYTSLGVFSITFLDVESLLLVFPPAACGISFRVHVDEGQIDRRGGVLHVSGNIRRTIAYTTNRRIVTNVIEKVEEGLDIVRLTVAEGSQAGLLLNLTPRLGYNRYIPNLEKSLRAAAQRWEEWFAAAPAVEAAYQKQYYYAWWVMRSGLISSRFYTTREAMTPSKVHYVGIWQWDSYFHALAYRHIDRRLAQDQIRVVLDHQRPDGMIPDAVHDEGVITHLTFPVEADVTKPPLLAWSAWKLYEEDGDREFLEEIYEPIARWNDWWLKYNDTDADGLCEYQHPFSSGLDDSPLWDQGMPVNSPDLNTYMVLQMENLGRIAGALGLGGESQDWQRKADLHLERMMKCMWDAGAGMFWPLHQGQAVRVETPFNLFPLLTGKLPGEVCARLVQRLTDPHKFWARYPVSTVAMDDPMFDPLQMWRGPTWVNVNYLLIEGLERSGYADVAQELRHRTLELLMGQEDIFEYYHPQTGEPGPKAAPIFGWSAAVLIELALQETAQQRR
jgi:putative isomerase